MERTLKEWLNRITDDVVRERVLSYLRKNRESITAHSLAHALSMSVIPWQTKEGVSYWSDIIETVGKHGDYPKPSLEQLIQGIIKIARSDAAWDSIEAEIGQIYLIKLR